MSSYLGFQPTKSKDYYFISYNNEDADRVGVITQKIAAAGVNLWYDHGIEYGDNWETVITERIQNAQAIVLFFTEGILQKSNSYVQKEYKIATEFFGKKVYVVLLDQIEKDEVPVEKVAWWMSINEKQCITGFEYTDTARLARDIIGALHGEKRQGSLSGTHAKKKAQNKPHRGCLTALIAVPLSLFLITGLAIAGVFAISQSLDSSFSSVNDFFDKLFSASGDPVPEDTDDPREETLREEKDSDDVIYFPAVSDSETEPEDQTNPPTENPTYTVTTYSNIWGDSEFDASDVFAQPHSQQFEAGETVTLTVNLPEGYNFLGWYERDTCLDTSTTYIFTMQEHDVEIEARFSCYRISTSTNDEYAGTYTEYRDRRTSIGQDVTLTATPAEGYNFDGWYNAQNGSLVSKEPTFTHIMQDEDVYFEARFTSYTVTTSAHNSYDGSDAGGSYTKLKNKKISTGTQVTLTATPNDGYNFAGWFFAGTDTLFSAEPTCTFTMEERDMHLEARFSSFTLTTSGYTYEGMAGSFTEYQYKQISIGTHITLTATTQNGYNFEGWYRGGVCVCTDLTYSFDMPDEDVYITAQFSKYTLNVTAENYEGTAGAVTKYKDEIIAAGEKVTLQASVNDGFNFEGWYIRGVRVSKELTYEYVMKKEDISIEAKYSYYTVSTSGYTFEGMAGSFAEYHEKKVSVGKEVTVMASVNEGYTFSGWYKGGVCVSDSLTYTFEMPEENVYLEAIYQEKY